MTTKIYVTSVQVEAAQLLVERSAARGEMVSRAIRMIAEAMPEPADPEDAEPGSAPADVQVIVSDRRSLISYAGPE